MNPKPVKKLQPCIELSIAESLIKIGSDALKESENAVKRLSELGIDITELETKLKHAKAAERVGKRLLKETYGS